MPAASPGGLSCFGISGPDSLQSFTPKHLAEKILASRRALEGERKRVTVLFCDIVGSTALAERLGEEPMHALINQFFVLTLAEVHRYEGTLSHFLGDGFMALFGAPVAHEDHAPSSYRSSANPPRTPGSKASSNSHFDILRLRRWFGPLSRTTQQQHRTVWGYLAPRWAG